MTTTVLNSERCDVLTARVGELMPGLRADLEALTSIPSISLSSCDPAPVRESAQKVADLFAAEGMDVEIVTIGDGHPAVLGELKGPEGAPTVLLYAHHDVQPVGDLNEWDSEPFTPTERNGRLYARGSADDKAGVIAHLAAVRALRDDLPCTIKIFIEGEEEVGSESLVPILQQHRERLDCDAIVIADSSNWEVGTPALTTTLRGNVRATVTVKALEHGIHSGMFGGVVIDAPTALCRLVASLHTDQGDVAIEGLVSSEDSELVYDEAQFRSDAGVPQGVQLIGSGSIVSRLWTKPSITLIGMDIPATDSAANVLLPTCVAKLSLRIAPTEDPQNAFNCLKQHLESQAPWGVEVTVEEEDMGAGFVAATSGPYVDAARAAFAQAWGTPSVDTGMGGSIPFISEFATTFPKASILVTGVEDPDTRAHGTNESLHLAEWHKVCVAEALILEQVRTITR